VGRLLGDPEVWDDSPAHALDVLPPGARVVAEVEGDQVVLKPTDGTQEGDRQ
jgi:hypothetical protein